MNNIKKIIKLRWKIIEILLVIFVLIFGSSCSMFVLFTDVEELDFAPSEVGWTEFTPSDDSYIVYVSASGNDATGEVYLPSDAAVGDDPFRPIAIKPFATFDAAFDETRNGSPDWILLERGHDFYGTLSARSGRSADEHFLIGSYGDTGLTPVINIAGENRGISLGEDHNYVTLMGLTFYAYTRDPDSPEFINTDGNSGIYFYAGDSDAVDREFLIEGCKFIYFEGNSFNNYGQANAHFTFRRCHFLNSYKDTGSHCQGLWAYHMQMTLEECIFDHNGWYSHPSDNTFGPATLYNHNSYMNSVSNSTFTSNIYLRSSSIGSKFSSKDGTSNLVINNNLYVDGELGIEISKNYDELYRYEDVTIINNVMTELGRTKPTDRELAYGINVHSINGGFIADNLLTHFRDYTGIDTGNILPLQVGDSSKDLEITDNVFFDLFSARGIVIYRPDEDHPGVMHEGIVIKDNHFQLDSADSIIEISYDMPSGVNSFLNNSYYADKTENIFRYCPDDVNKVSINFSDWQSAFGDTSTFEEVSYPDSGRDIAGYTSSATSGSSTTVDDFIQHCRDQDRYAWDDRFNATEINDWLREGYGM